jgi:hypothetical protein
MAACLMYPILTVRSAGDAGTLTMTGTSILKLSLEQIRLIIGLCYFTQFSAEKNVSLKTSVTIHYLIFLLTLYNMYLHFRSKEPKFAPSNWPKIFLKP